MPTKIKVTDFDFDTIKGNLRTFLQTRPEFTDYNFAASNLNVIIDILTHNTHYQALMANFLANEMFLDTAVKRSSVISHAKTLGYVPKSRTASRVTIDVSFFFESVADPGTSFNLPKGTLFPTNIDGVNYNFVTASNYSAPLINTSGNNYEWVKSGINLYEGDLTQNTVTYSSITKKFSIPDINVDLSTMILQVGRENSLEYDIYQYASNLIDIGVESQVYFIQEGFDGRFEVYFGDGVFGQQPADGVPIIMSYVVTHGGVGNGASQYLLNNPNSSLFPQETYYHLPIIGTSSGGSDRESIQSIKFNSINAFGTQNRAVVPSDYAGLARGMSGNIKDILSWGGEDNNPPLYNTTVLCAVPYVGEDLTRSDKDSISTQLKKKAVGTTNIVFVTPEYLDMSVDLSFTYDTKLINISVFELETRVRATVATYARDNLYAFAGTFKQSKFLSTIDKVDDAISGSQVDITLIKTLDVVTYRTQSHSIDFSNPILTGMKASTLSSTYFYINSISTKCQLEEDGNGNVHVVTRDTVGTKVRVLSNIGVIDYDKGTLIFTLFISSFEDSKFKVWVKAKSNDVFSTKNVILRIKNENIKVSSKGE